MVGAHPVVKLLVKGCGSPTYRTADGKNTSVPVPCKVMIVHPRKVVIVVFL